MSSIALIAANHFAAPVLGRCAVIATSTSSAITDLTADPRISAHLSDGTILELIADADMYIAFNNANSGAIDETANSGATSCWKLPANLPKRVIIAKGYTFLLTKAGAATPKLRIHAVGFADMAKTGT